VLQASFFDGRSTRVRAVSLSVAGADLVITGEDVDIRTPFVRVQVDERLGRAPRRLRLQDGSFCEVRDRDALDSLLSLAGHRDGRVDWVQRQWSLVALAMVAFIAIAAAGYAWGLPWAAVHGARRLPPAVGRTLGTQALKALDGGLLVPSTLPAKRRQELEARFRTLRLPDGQQHVAANLVFRRSPGLGANAFALPDGTIVVLDDLITALDDDEQIIAVLAHELGHVQGRHGLQLLLRSSAVGAFTALYLGDISPLLAAAPAALVSAHYSQDLEQEADDYAAATLRANGMSPGLLADALDTQLKSHPDTAPLAFLASHPPTTERMRRLRRQASLAPK
jgi:Zn-dependent protease with chaperone function